MGVAVLAACGLGDGSSVLHRVDYCGHYDTQLLAEAVPSWLLRCVASSVLALASPLCSFQRASRDEKRDSQVSVQ